MARASLRIGLPQGIDLPQGIGLHETRFRVFDRPEIRPEIRREIRRNQR